MKKMIVILVAMFSSLPAYALVEQIGAQGKVSRIVVNHSPAQDTIYIQTDDPNPLCAGMGLTTYMTSTTLTQNAYDKIYAAILAAQMAHKTIIFWTDESCLIFKIDMHTD